MKNILKYALLTSILAFSGSIVANAVPTYTHREPSARMNVAPEVDPALAIIGISLLAGTLTVMRARRNK
jgi:hypothetical protein